ncbi:MAG: hypothetical protein K5639_08635 [Eubacterium sp.]|nr:hypothetical protein [Eubacterium sp.]
MKLRRNLITIIVSLVYVVLMAYATMTAAAKVYENFSKDGNGLILTGIVLGCLIVFFVAAFFLKGRSVLESLQKESAPLIIVEAVLVIGIIGAGFFLYKDNSFENALWLSGMLAATYAVCRALGGRICGVMGLACQFALMLTLFEGTKAELVASEFLNVFCIIIPLFIFIIFIKHIIPSFSGSMVMLVFADCLMGLVFAIAILFNPMAIWLTIGCVLSMYQSCPSDAKDAENPLTKGFMIGFIILVITAILVFVFSLVLDKNPTAVFNISFNEMFNLSLTDGTIYDFCVNKLSRALDTFLLSPYKYGVFPTILLLFGVFGGVFTAVRKSSSFSPMLFVMTGVIATYITVSSPGDHFYYMSLMISICAAYGFYNTIIPEKLVQEEDEEVEAAAENYYKGPQPRSEKDIDNAIAATHMSALDIVEDPSANVIAEKKTDPKKDVNVVNKEYVASFSEDPRMNPNTMIGANALNNEDTDEFQTPDGVVGGPRNAIEGASYGDEDSKLKVDNTGEGDEKNYIDFKNAEIGPEDMNKIGYQGPKEAPKPMENAIEEPQEIQFGDLFKADDVQTKPKPESEEIPEEPEVITEEPEPAEEVAEETVEDDSDPFDLDQPEAEQDFSGDVTEEKTEEVEQEIEEPIEEPIGEPIEEQQEETKEETKEETEEKTEDKTEDKTEETGESVPEDNKNDEGDEEMSKKTTNDEKGFSSAAPTPIQKQTLDNRINGPLNTDPSHFMEWHVSEEYIREEEIAKMKAEKEAEKEAANIAAKEAASTVVGHSEQPESETMPGKGDVHSDKVDEFDKGVLDNNNLDYRPYEESTMLDKTTTDESNTTVDIKSSIAEEDEEENINSKIYSAGIDDGERAIESTYVPEDDTILGGDSKKKANLTTESSDSSQKPEDILTAIENAQVPNVEIPDLNKMNESDEEEDDEELNDLLERLDMSESIKRLKESAREDIADVIEQDQAEAASEEEVVLSNTDYNFGTSEEYGEVPTISDLEDRWRAEQQMQEVDESEVPDVVSADDVSKDEDTQDVADSFEQAEYELEPDSMIGVTPIPEEQVEPVEEESVEEDVVEEEQAEDVTDAFDFDSSVAEDIVEDVQDIDDVASGVFDEVSDEEIDNNIDEIASGALESIDAADDFDSYEDTASSSIGVVPVDTTPIEEISATPEIKTLADVISEADEVQIDDTSTDDCFDDTVEYEEVAEEPPYEESLDIGDTYEEPAEEAAGESTYDDSLNIGDTYEEQAEEPTYEVNMDIGDTFEETVEDSTYDDSLNIDSTYETTVEESSYNEEDLSINETYEEPVEAAAPEIIEEPATPEPKPGVDESMAPKITVSRVKNHVDESPVVGFTKQRPIDEDLSGLGIPKPSDEPDREPDIDYRRKRRQRADIFEEEIHTENITKRTAGGMRSYHKFIIKRDDN